MLSRRDVLLAGTMGVAAAPVIAGAKKKPVPLVTAAISHRTIDVNGIQIHIAEQGEGPLILLCHGFPEQLTIGESAWVFTPDAPWRSGAYKLVVRGTLEHPAGNRLGSRFETSIDSPPGPVAAAEILFVVPSTR